MSGIEFLGGLDLIEEWVKQCVLYFDAGAGFVLQHATDQVEEMALIFLCDVDVPLCHETTLIIFLEGIISKKSRRTLP